MKEVEVKILEVDRDRIEAVLANRGAKKVFDGNIQTMLFDFKDGSIVKGKDVLRLRKEGERVELTYKKVKFTKKAKVAEEYSVRVSNLETTKEILENLDLTVIENILKHRTSYVLDHVRFDIDRYLEDFEHIPEFMEIEAENIEVIHKYAGLLGFSPEKCLPWSTQDVINYYNKKA